ncbi:MAG: ribokinase, partial [Pseudomonadota bacterium]
PIRGGRSARNAMSATKMPRITMRAGGDVTFLTRLGDDTFGAMAQQIWSDAGVRPEIRRGPNSETGAAYIFVDDETGDNAIIVCPGAATEIGSDDIDAWAADIESAAIFMTQLEQPISAAVDALARAHAAGATTIFNPAPAATVPDTIWGSCSYVTPNETEASELTGVPVDSVDSARRAGDKLLQMGAGTALITLGEAGALLHTKEGSEQITTICNAPVVDTTGAGDAFNGGFAAALAEGRSPRDAALFGSATAGIAVTRQGTAGAMPSRAEIDAALARI